MKNITRWISVSVIILIMLSLFFLVRGCEKEEGNNLNIVTSPQVDVEIIDCGPTLICDPPLVCGFEDICISEDECIQDGGTPCEEWCCVE